MEKETPLMPVEAPAAARIEVVPAVPEVEAAAAAFLAAGIGSFALGLFTTLAEASAAVKNLLNIHDPVGPLSGKTTFAVAAFLVSWAALHRIFLRRPVRFGRAFALALVLVLLGFVGTFPVFFALFHH